MEEKDRILIEQYIAGELSPAEQREVEIRMQADPGFRTEYEEYKLAMDAIKLAQREELRERFRQRDRVLDKRDSGFLHRPRSIWLLAASVIAVIAVVWWLYQLSKPVAEENIITNQDTIRQEVPVQQQPDTSIMDRSHEPGGMAVKPRPKNLPSKEGEDLFAANFEPYTDESLDPTSRGGEDATAIDRFQTLYFNKEYSRVTDAFTQMAPEYQQNDNLRFLYAVALIAIGKVAQAETELTEILQNQKSAYLTESIFYLAMAQLYRGEFPGARYNLEAYLQKPDAEHKDKAAKILSKLN